VQTHNAHVAWALHTLHMHVKFTLHTPCTHTPNMPYTCRKHVLTQTAHELHTCHSHAIHRRHTFHMHTFMNAQAYCTTCKNARSSMHIQRMHTQCMHGPHKKHSIWTHATLTYITDATYVTYISMMQAYQRHTLCEYCMQTACHTCIHACQTHTTYIACTLIINCYLDRDGEIHRM
jgi:hypothetical protein